MDRKEFIKSLGALAGIVATVPSMLVGKNKVEEEEIVVADTETTSLKEPKPVMSVDLGKNFRDNDIVVYTNDEGELEQARYFNKKLYRLRDCKRIIKPRGKVMKLFSSAEIC